MAAEPASSAAALALAGAPERDPLYPAGVLMVAGGAVCLSFTGLFLRFVEAAGAWQILFWRSIFFVLTVLLLLAARHRGRLVAPIRHIGASGIVIALLLTVVFTGFIYALTLTTVANVVFTLGAGPFIAALLGWWVLGERIRRATAIAIAAVVAGVALMVADGLTAGRLAGNLIALLVVLAFACQLILLRRARGVDMVPATGLAGLFVILVSALMADGLAISARDLFLAFLLGTLNIGAGIILITSGARHVPAAEVALLGLVEAVFAPLWVWLIVDERPSALTLTGGAIVLSAVAATALLGLRRERRHPA